MHVHGEKAKSVVYDDGVAVDGVAFRYPDDATVDGIDRRAGRSMEVHSFMGDGIGAAVAIVTVRVGDRER